METTVEFESQLFVPFLPDEAQVNPHVLGAELAWWLSAQLAQRDVFTSYPRDEDWGWYIEYRTGQDDRYLLCCSSIDGAKDRWQCRLEPQARSLFGRNMAPVENARPLLANLRAVLAEETRIRDVRWE